MNENWKANIRALALCIVVILISILTCGCEELEECQTCDVEITYTIDKSTLHYEIRDNKLIEIGTVTTQVAKMQTESEVTICGELPSYEQRNSSKDIKVDGATVTVKTRMICQ